jgi:hypothetical protein
MKPLTPTHRCPLLPIRHHVMRVAVAAVARIGALDRVRITHESHHAKKPAAWAGVDLHRRTGLVNSAYLAALDR